MKTRRERAPAFEFKVAARAGEITFHQVGDVEWRIEGTGQTERTRRHDGLPSPVRPYVRYTNIRVSCHVKAWLDTAVADFDGLHGWA